MSGLTMKELLEFMRNLDSDVPVPVQAVDPILETRAALRAELKTLVESYYHGDRANNYRLVINGEIKSVYPTKEEADQEAREYKKEFPSSDVKVVEFKNWREVHENLRKWFKEKWVRFGPDGKIRGDCARGDEGEGKPKCLPQSKAHSLGKKGRKYAASKKRREDPNPERRGKAINVATKKKTNEGELDEACWKGYHKEGMKTMFGKRYPNCVKNKKRKSNEDISENQKYDLPPQETIIQWFTGQLDKINNFRPGFTDPIIAKLSSTDRSDLPKKVKIMILDYIKNNPDKTSDNKWFVAQRDLQRSLNQSVTEDQLDEKWSKKYKRSIDCDNPKGFSQRAHCQGRKKTESIEESHQCPHCGGPMYSEEMLNEKKDACYYKVKSRYKVWPSAYASGALVKCRKVGARKWGSKGK